MEIGRCALVSGRFGRLVIGGRCCLLVLLGWIAFLVVAFREGILWGLGVLFLPLVSLIFLVLLQLTKAIGEGGLIRPELAAWLPGFLFAIIGGYLLIKVRT